ncbi:MAG TPA: dephospho-CoA kinase [Desulfotomaculum sp.]|nr:MAG: dephospho-CoA kinase [Peptococcaceae bacterium BRH_c8a]KJS76049.1 MAG: dephospho-CoA kinase [Desulfotomaculum sp. BICA1-6]HBX24592.1 dephospho-CoA kinase [Desulfotomaculum sp.]
MPVVGLTGNIGSGKSTVARMLNELGALVLDTDQVARDVVAPGTPALQKIMAVFGRQALNPDGTLNRARMAQLVFTDPRARDRLNGIVHPDIRAVTLQTIADYRINGNAPLLVIEAPLMIETGMHLLMDELWLVTVDPVTQLVRVTARDGSEEDALRRMNAQLPQEEKIPLAHRIIDNSGTLNATRLQVLRTWKVAIKTNSPE